MTICHITAPASYGGLESVVTALARGMSERGHRVRILALLGTTGNLSAFETLISGGIEVVPITTPRRHYRAEIAAVAKELLQNPGSIAHTHGYHADLIGWRAARRAGVPVVSTVHGYTGGDRKNRLYEWVDRRALRHFDAVVAVSEPLRTSLAEYVRPDKLLVMVNAGTEIPGVKGREESRRQLGLPQEGLIAGWVGRLSSEKGPDLYLDALHLAPSWKGAVLGDGVLREALETRSRSSGLAGRIWWLGSIPKASVYLRAFDAIVLSSRSEGTPIVLLEAMTAGVPVVTTAVGGIPYVVSDSEAFLVSPENPVAISEELERIARDPSVAATKSAAARVRLQRERSMDGWLDGYERLYRQLEARTA